MISKNIWVAAGDGDLARVQMLLESDPTLNANIEDPNQYTPMHAAASYGQVDVLEYLVSRGGNVNVTDGDGDTPLYTVENVTTAKWLVEHGAIIDRRNGEGISPAEHLLEDFPEVAQYLSTVSQVDAPVPVGDVPLEEPSKHAQEQVSNELTVSLINDVTAIAHDAERDGTEIDESRLREAVSRAVMGGVLTGFDMTQTSAGLNEDSPSELKRRREGAE